MYIPSQFARTDAADLRALIREHGYATLITTDATGAAPLASHPPLRWVDDARRRGRHRGRGADARRA